MKVVMSGFEAGTDTIERQQWVQKSEARVACAATTYGCRLAGCNAHSTEVVQL